MITIAPILIILVIIIIAFIFMMRKRTLARGGNHAYSKRVRWIVGGYLAILLICAGIDVSLPVKGTADMKTVHMKDLEQESLALYKEAIAGRIDKVDPAFIDKEWNFDLQDTKLNLTVVNNEFLSLLIVVERKTTNDGKLEAVLYKTRSSMNDIDITQQIHSPQIQLEGNELAINLPKRSIITFSQFQQAFTINQFTGEKTFSHQSSFFDGQTILYLQIPKDLELINKTDLTTEFVK